MHLVKLPNSEFINLALIERVEIDKIPLLVLIHWSGDKRSVYTKEDGQAVIEAIAELAIDKSYVRSAIAAT